MSIAARIQKNLANRPSALASLLAVLLFLLPSGCNEPSQAELERQNFFAELSSQAATAQEQLRAMETLLDQCLGDITPFRSTLSTNSQMFTIKNGQKVPIPPTDGKSLSPQEAQGVMARFDSLKQNFSTPLTLAIPLNCGDCEQPLTTLKENRDKLLAQITAAQDAYMFSVALKNTRLGELEALNAIERPYGGTEAIVEDATMVNFANKIIAALTSGQQNLDAITTSINYQSTLSGYLTTHQKLLQANREQLYWMEHPSSGLTFPTQDVKDSETAELSVFNDALATARAALTKARLAVDEAAAALEGLREIPPATES